MFKFAERTSCWQRLLAVAVLSFPLAFGIRFILQCVIPRNVAAEATTYVRERKTALSEPLAQLLTDANYTPRPTQHHFLVGHPAPRFVLQNDRFETVSLDGLLRERPVVLVFYYGYHCSHCVAQLFALSEDICLFEELGAQVVAISGDPTEQTAERFLEYGRFHFPVLSDPGQRVAAAYGAYQPAEGDRPESRAHGTFVIGVDGRVLWADMGPEPFLDNRTLLIELSRAREDGRGK